MKKYSLVLTENFNKDFSKIIPNNLKEYARRRLELLEFEPYRGKVLCYDFFREIKIKKFRIYYMIYEDVLAVLAIAVGDKKTQKNMIESIKQKRKYFAMLVLDSVKYISKKR